MRDIDHSERKINKPISIPLLLHLDSLLFAMDIDSTATLNASEAAFVSWLTGHGGVISPSVGLSQFEGMGRGAVALVDIPVRSLLQP